MAVVLSWGQWKLFLVIFCSVQVVTGKPIVCLRSKSKECIIGVEKVTSLTIEYEAFVGIPFAEPPIGRLRFANPVPSGPWIGVYDATQPKPVCIQRNGVLAQADVIGSEDCLYLNVYRPKKAARDLPVLVYIYGDAFQSGSADPTISNPGWVMNSRDVIMVTVSYRLGALGFLSTGDSVAPGNFGLKDQSMAIRWVRNHIHNFGGDNQLITVFGEGSGAASTQYHMMSPLSRGNFSRAILMSGSALAPYARPNPDPLQIARLQAGVFGLTQYDTATSLEVIKLLRSISAEHLVDSINAVAEMVPNANFGTIYGPVIEQYVDGQSFLHESPLTLWTDGNYEQIPWMAGHVPNNWTIFKGLLQGLPTDPTQWSSTLDEARSLLTQYFQLNLLAAPALLQRYFAGVHTETTSPSEVVDQVNNLLIDAQFEYPMLKSVTQHLQQYNRIRAPVSVYFMQFSPPNSASTRTDGPQDVLRRPALLRDYPFGSPGYLMVTKMVKLFVEFARTGDVLYSYLGTCPSRTHCQQIEFSNNAVRSDRVQVRLTNAIDYDLLNFWDDLYGNFSIAVGS